MHKRLTALIVILLIGLALPWGAISVAQPTPPDARVSLPRVKPERIAGFNLMQHLRRDYTAPQASGPKNVMIELADEPSIRTFAAMQATEFRAQANAAAQAQLARIEQAQQALLVSLADLDASLLYRTQKVYNGIAVRVDASQLAQIRQLPGVKAIHTLVPQTIDHTTSVPLIGAPDLWNPAGLNLTGDSIDIAVIDSGIDYLHADFGGAGAITPTLYTNNDTTVIGDVPGFPGTKVVGGHDFVGDLYDANCTAAEELNGLCTATPQPDPDPAGCLTGGNAADHGTHVAGTAGGYGVDVSGATYTGTYSSTLDFASTFRIGPGVAPEARLYALRIFGCDGSTNVTVEAIEWAVDPDDNGNFSDHVDVINMSLGSDFGGNDDPSAVASDNASLAGVIVVAAAGNAGDTYYDVGSPSTADRAISVASSVDSSNVLDGFRVNPPSGIAGVYAAAESVAFNWTSVISVPITGTLVYPAHGPTSNDERTGCYTFSAGNIASITGNIVLLDWNEPSCGGSVTRTGNALAAGATGVIIADDSEVFDLFITGSSVIPAVSTSKQIGDQLKANLPLSVTLSHEYQSSVVLDDPAIVDTVSTFSSRGPRRTDTALKPDVTAVGDSVFSAFNGTGNKGLNFSGTSMATPHVAGSMALLRQQHPTWSVEELKALIMNSAAHDLRSGVPPTSTLYGPPRVGSGRVDLVSAAGTNVVAYNAGVAGAVSVSFGAPEVLNTQSFTRQVHVVNKSAQAVTYTISYSPRITATGVTFTPASTVVVPALGSTNFSVTMTANASQLLHEIDPTVNVIQEGDFRHWLTEAGGNLLLTPIGGGQTQVLRVPVYAAPRPISDMSTVQSSLTFSITSEISLTGQGITTGGLFDLPPDITSLVTAVELQYTSPDESDTMGVANNADLQYVGVTSDFGALGQVISSTLYFGIATHSNWTSLNDVEFDIYIDADRNGSDDYVIFNYAFPTAGGDPTDTFYSVVVDLNLNSIIDVLYVNEFPALFLDTVVFNTNMIVLPVPADDLGLTNGNSRFNYRVYTFSADVDGFQSVVDTTPVLTYDAGNPGLDFSGGVPGIPIWPDLDGIGIDVTYDYGAYQANKSQGALLLHHHNGTGNHAEVVSTSARLIYLPIVRKP